MLWYAWFFLKIHLKSLFLSFYRQKTTKNCITIRKTLHVKIVPLVKEIFPEILSKISAFVILQTKNRKKNVYLVEKRHFLWNLSLVHKEFSSSLKTILYIRLLQSKTIFANTKKRLIWVSIEIPLELQGFK